MTYPIEVVSVGEEDLYDDIIAACELLNNGQREFYFTAPPVRLRGSGFRVQPNDADGYLTLDAFEYLHDYRREARGHRPYLIGVLNGQLRSNKWKNIFGSHEAADGLAIITLHQQAAYTESRLQYLCYYLIRYSLSFIAPEIKSHNVPERKECLFHFKQRKTDLTLSIAAGAICPVCMKKLSQRLNPEDHQAIKGMIEFMRSPAKKRHADVAVITIVTEETIGIVKRLQSDERYFREGSGALSDRYYYEGRLKAAGGGHHSLVCTQSLKQGNRPVASAYSHITAEYTPNLVVLLGIAGAIHKSIDVCDAMFAESILYYDQRKVTADGTLHRGHGYNLAPWLQKWLNAFFVRHGEPAAFPAVDGSKNQKYRVHKGPLGSGEAVVANRAAEIRQWLTRVNDKTLALETEAGGLAEVFDEEQLKRGYRADGYLVVRGISDHADQEKSDDYRQACVDNAMVAFENLLAVIPPFSSLNLKS